jgi:hypothetical protein
VDRYEDSQRRLRRNGDAMAQASEEVGFFLDPASIRSFSPETPD